MTYLNLLFVTVVVVFVVDLSGVTSVLLRVVSAWSGRQFKSLRPFTCSLCMTWWVGLACCAAWRCLDWPHVAYVAVLAFLTTSIVDTLRLFKDSITAIINVFYRKKK